MNDKQLKAILIASLLPTTTSVIYEDKGSNSVCGSMKVLSIDDKVKEADEVATKIIDHVNDEADHE